jgi:hypothetical protein
VQAGARIPAPTYEHGAPPGRSSSVAMQGVAMQGPVNLFGKPAARDAQKSGRGARRVAGPNRDTFLQRNRRSRASTPLIFEICTSSAVFTIGLWKRWPPREGLQQSLPPLGTRSRNTAAADSLCTDQRSAIAPLRPRLGCNSSALGENPKTRRKARANWLADPKPVASAISTMASEVSRSSCRERSKRKAR